MHQMIALITEEPDSVETAVKAADSKHRPGATSRPPVPGALRRRAFYYARPLEDLSCARENISRTRGPRKAAWKKAKPREARAKNRAEPETAILRYSPTDGAHSHPDWVKTQFPTYIVPHHGHEATAPREFTHRGHLVKIFTTYRVEVDGHPIGAHLSVDEDGRVYTHATPFVTYASAIDLMKAVIDGYPDSFSDAGGGHGGHP